ncbi:conserved repeat domain-containing protein [Variovorax sp. PDC80]|uniref:DUF11 domain-containing protein n=2 Tax=unclassified Variovorax TaxID=663243 RepID=UPI0008E0A9BD|nr:DUF11 domain-containing protein [Variovorax sp. PDC80]SFO52329.1 conserved repeat domain-containing protein [Variovorax sp. PDC80]
MIPTLSARRAGPVPRTLWAGAAALTLSFLFGSDALAAAPPANTIIGNQASATYLDPNGASQLATSNLVQTTVQQVGSFNLDGRTTVTTDVINKKIGAAGAIVYAPHVLTNTGNGSDKFTITIDNTTAAPDGFSKIEVFADADADGLPDSTTALCSVAPNAVCTVPAQTVAGGNGTFPFVVAYSIPSTATAANFTSPRPATINAVPATLDLYEVANQKAADLDHVVLTVDAAFNASKSLRVPAVSWVANGGVWPAAKDHGPRSAASCQATIAGATSNDPNCSYTTYTLQFNNTGGAAGKFYMTDTLPSGFTYVPGSAVWSSAPGRALGDAAGSADDPNGIDFFANGQKLSFLVSSLAPNVTQTVSFVVLVNSTAEVGGTTTTNRADYIPEKVPDDKTTTNPPTDPTTPTNDKPFIVDGTFGIVLGSAHPTASPVASKDAEPGKPLLTDADQTTLASGVAGSTVKFTQTVFNTGNADDIVNLTADLSKFPAGSTFRFFADGGFAPLIDNNSDGIVDTGPIRPGQSVKIVLAVTLGAPASIPTQSFEAIVLGTSTKDSTKFDATRDILSKLIGVLVDMTNTASGNGTSGNTGNGDVGTGPSPTPTTTTTTPAGTPAVFNLFIKNNDSLDNAFSLAASQTNSFPGSLPSGWTVKFVAAGATCTATGMTTVNVAAGTQVAVDACVTPPASQAPVEAQLIYFQVRSTSPTSTGAVAIDTKLDAVKVIGADTWGATLTPNNEGQVAPGGSVVYAHTLTITGAQSCGTQFNIKAVLPVADVTAGWTTALYLDNNGDGQIDTGDTLVGANGQVGPTVDLSGGKAHKLLVKVFAPGGATAGTTDTATVTVTFPEQAKCGEPSATDITTVITGQMRLIKLQAKDENCDGTEAPTSSAALAVKPGQCIVYRIVATNEGASPVTNMSINDAVPAYTSLTAAPDGAQPSEQCASAGVTPAFAQANYTATASSVSCGSAANTVAPGGKATLTFSVKVNK